MNSTKKPTQMSLEALYTSNMKMCKKVLTPITSVENRLGPLDAIKEWNNVEEACIKFLNTEAYKTFIKEDYILLIGRTGTGKTAILNRYKFEVENKTNSSINFNHVINIEFKPYLIELLRSGNIRNTEVGLSDLQDNITMLINLEVLRLVYLKTNFVDGDYSSSTLIKKYFADKKINVSINIFQQAIEGLSKIYKDTVAGNVLDTISVLAKMLEQYKTSDFNNIMTDIYNYLENNRVLVLIDSMDRYDVREAETVLIIQSLVAVAFHFFRHPEYNIIVKVALPAELSSIFIYQLPEKDQSNIVSIEWKYKELVKMIAIRFLYYCRNKTENKELIQISANYEIDKFYDDYDEAKKFLLLFIPEKCPANVTLCFDSLAYCIRHTQKKPRQLMKVFNMFIDCFEKQQNIQFFFDFPRKIAYYIHRTQQNIIHDSLNMYNNLTDNYIIDVCTEAMTKKENIITRKELTNSIKQAIKNIYKTQDKNKYNLDADDYFEMLKESGLIGKIYSERYVEANNPWFENPNVLKIIIALFEYQTKEQLLIREDEYCVLHPMCYEYFENVIDYNALVYPLPIDDEEDIEQMSFYLKDLLFD